MAARALPNWPARLSEDQAAAYLDVSKTTFRAGYGAGRYPAPLREGRRLFWSRRQLDRFVDGQFGLVANDVQEGAGWAS